MKIMLSLCYVLFIESGNEYQRQDRGFRMMRSLKGENLTVRYLTPKQPRKIVSNFQYLLDIKIEGGLLLTGA